MRVLKFSQRQDIIKRIQKHGYVVNDDGCWIWQGDKLKNGYGRLWVNGKTRTIHRISYELWNGEIPDGLLVRHKCDVRDCINPLHLEPGTWADNMRDKYERGRANMPKGKDHYLIKRKMADAEETDIEEEN